jgi:predicted nuclease of restriction endonuclease-like (RecB) superfamily
VRADTRHHGPERRRRTKIRPSPSLPIGLPADYAWVLADLKDRIARERLRVTLSASIREWYIRRCLEHGWSRSILALQIDNHAHERQGQALSNFRATLPPTDSDCAAMSSSSSRRLPSKPPSSGS